MKRLNPLGSILGITFTLLLFVGLGVSLWYDRGMAFSPGKVTAKSQAGVKLGGFSSHADFEKRCGYCHEPLRTNLASKCLGCHTVVQDQIQNKRGVHSQAFTSNACASCHPEHRGRNFDPTLASIKLFDHSVTSFSMVWHQANYDTTPMQCSQCHDENAFSSVSTQTCLDCHSTQDSTFSRSHVQDFGADCLGCHDGADRMEKFEHGITKFALEGKHDQIKCTACHNIARIRDTPNDCQSCHPEPSIHQGLFAQACDNCHTARGWSPATFDNRSFSHLSTAGFSLGLHQVDYANQALTCISCHPKDLQLFDPQLCMDCHDRQDTAFMTDHIQQYSPKCLTCHDGVDRLSNFNHDNFFALNGKHAELECADCHANQEFRGTPSECSQCHSEPEIHSGIFGDKCYYCHAVDVWSPASLREHQFPLTHGLQDASTQLPCESCHVTNYLDYTCYTCHDHRQEQIIQSHQEAGIAEQELPGCARCHPDGTSSSAQADP